MGKTIKIDLHTHSILSRDGGINLEQYEQLFRNGTIDVAAITDHNEISFAVDAHKKLGDRIIVGEEIMTTDGEVIGLFLMEKVPSHLSLAETIAHIKKQGGIVYVPHPFETIRKGLDEAVLLKHIKDIDIIETANGRAFLQDASKQAYSFAKKHKKTGAAGSDSHCKHGVGNTYATLSSIPGRNNFLELFANASLCDKRMNILHAFCPQINRIKKLLI